MQQLGPKSTTQPVSLRAFGQIEVMSMEQGVRHKDIERLIGRGDLFAAYDLARGFLDEGDDDERVRYLAVLALARAGATEFALEEYRRLELHQVDNVDCAAIEARLMKDQALTLKGRPRDKLLRLAGEAYFKIYLRFGTTFPAINAATLMFLSGDSKRAEDLAKEILASAELNPAKGYYGQATCAEALLITGDIEGTIRALREAYRFAGQDFGALATTRRQLGRLLEKMRKQVTSPDDVLAALPVPKIAHLVGVELGMTDKSATDIATSLDSEIKENDIGFAYTTLLCDSELLGAERILACGSELNLVLPCRLDDFLEGVAKIFPDGVKRVQSCLDAAASVTNATHDSHLGDTEQAEYARMVAMGLTRVRAQNLATGAIQLAILDEASPTAGSATPCVHSWTHSGGQTLRLGPCAQTSAKSVAPPMPLKALRVQRAMIFADVPGFTRLRESDLPTFWAAVMGAAARVLNEYKDVVLHRNTWGDAIFVVAQDVASAALISLELGEAIAAIDPILFGGTAPIRLRIGAHHGPVYTGKDPFRGETAFYGSQVSRAARVEPVTPPGSVFVTEPFAAILAIEAGDRFTCVYAGRVTLPKGYGDHRMYRLLRNPGIAG